MTVMAGEMRESLLKRASIHGGHFDQTSVW